MSRYWSLHTHTKHSRDDALSDIKPLVGRAVELGYPALSTTDHGNMAAVYEAYMACKKEGLPYAPGVEMYVTPHHESRIKSSMHLTMCAYTTQGYYNLVALHNQAHQQWFNNRPRLDMADLAAAAEAGRTAGIAVATGCRSGPVVKALVDRGPEAAEQVAAAIAGWFPRVYVELMDHSFKAEGLHDSEIVEQLVLMAERLGLPTILTGDAHYVLEEEKKLHDGFKRLVSFDPTSAEFSGSGYWLPDTEYMRARHLDGWEGLADLAGAIKVAIPEYDTFTLKIPDVLYGKDPDDALAAKVYERTDIGNAVVAERVLDEQDVIRKTGMAPYLHLVHMITDWMEEEGIWYYARGSVAGSRICYDLKISSTDPILWNIRMDRFLSGDRTSIPDIDLDIEHERRKELMTMLEDKGYELVQVGTQNTYGLKGDQNDDEGGSSGSLMRSYFSTLKQLGDTETTWDNAPREDKSLLFELADLGLVSSVGAHPGGFVVARDKPTVAALPLVKIFSSDTTVTAFTKDEVEALGYPKIDMLGSKVLTGLKHACMDICETDDPKVARDWYRALPLDDKATLKRIAKGRTAGLFQLGGWTNRKVCMEVKPKKTIDVVAVQALGRPAPMKSGFTDQFLERRRGEVAIPVMHTDIAQETAESYGLAIYQEQVVGMLRRMGVQPQQLTRILKAVKSSGKAGEAKAKQIVAEEIGSITEMARERGWSQADLAYLERCLIDYGAGYSFGKAHSVTYGVVAYNTGYLATNYPLSYWTGMLNAYRGSGKNNQGEKPEEIYTRAARDDSIRVKDPHVNTSELGYVADHERTEILKPLTVISGLGDSAAAEIIEKRPFETIQDLAQRCTGKVSGCKQVVYMSQSEFAEWLKGGEKPNGTHLAALHDAGALRGLPYGDPIRRAKGRIRRCKECKHTFPTPLDYEDHLEETHGAQDEPAPTGAVA